ncbi:hypothetical protein [Streptomyces sp. NPDC048106]|uniref:hypothetical protein n=1 Tax=Streptomyces sp. NPDC048106 TaxID=3155750 RepID=UPI003453FF06
MATDDAKPTDARAAPPAPLPDHRDVNMPWWQELWRRHAHITTPLRARGLPCDIEFGLSAYIVRVSLPDDSCLIIGPPQEPPSDRPPGDPEGWIVTRERISDRSSLSERIYDSAPAAYPGGPEQPEARHGGSVQPLIEAIDHRLAQLGLLPHRLSPTANPPTLTDTTTHHTPKAPAIPNTTDPASASAYGDAILALTDQLNGSQSYTDAAALLHQIADPNTGLLERLADFVEAAAEKAKESEDDDGFDLSYDLADAAADIRKLVEVLDVAEDRMRALSPVPATPRPPAGPSRTPAPAPPGLPPAAPRRAR